MFLNDTADKQNFYCVFNKSNSCYDWLLDGEGGA